MMQCAPAAHNGNGARCVTIGSWEQVTSYGMADLDLMACKRVQHRCMRTATRQCTDREQRHFKLVFTRLIGNGANGL